MQFSGGAQYIQGTKGDERAIEKEPTVRPRWKKTVVGKRERGVERVRGGETTPVQFSSVQFSSVQFSSITSTNSNGETTTD